MIEYHYELDFRLKDITHYTDWITRVLKSEERKVGQINYIFCADEYLLNHNQRFLNHDTFTDILTFDYSDKDVVSGDIFISIERVKDNARKLGEPFKKEVLRVMCHGLLHMIGYDDKTEDDKNRMRVLEETKMNMFHVEQ